MLLLLDIPQNTELIELICLAQSRGITYKAANQLEELVDFIKKGSIGKTYLPVQTISKTIKTMKKDQIQKQNQKQIQTQIQNQSQNQNQSPNENSECGVEKIDNDQAKTNEEESKKKKKGPKAITEAYRSACTICGAKVAATSRRYLLIHARNHLEVLGYKCSICQARFMHQGSARAHIIKQHKPEDLGIVVDVFTQADHDSLEEVATKCFPDGVKSKINTVEKPVTVEQIPVQTNIKEESSIDEDVICIDESGDEDTNNAKKKMLDTYAQLGGEPTENSTI